MARRGKFVFLKRLLLVKCFGLFHVAQYLLIQSEPAKKQANVVRQRAIVITYIWHYQIRVTLNVISHHVSPARSANS